MRRLGLIVAGAAVWLLIAVPVFADNGPHQVGSSSPTTDSCSGCHRAHTAQGANLLANPSQTSLCYTCHGRTGAGATTNVQDGQQYAPRHLEKVTTVVRDGTTLLIGGLRAGGFDKSAINTAPTLRTGPIGYLTTPVTTTSSHATSGTATAWGNGAIGSGAGKDISMTCGSCHDPHGNGNYRILKPIPEGSGVTTGVTIPDVVAGADYRYTTLNYWQPDDANQPDYLTNVTAWCSTCHTRYMAPAGAETNTSNDPIFTYRHRTTEGAGTQCVQCHVAHGSNASMGTNSQGVPLPGESTGRGPDSSLLKVDNRGICLRCHEDK